MTASCSAADLWIRRVGNRLPILALCVSACRSGSRLAAVHHRPRDRAFLLAETLSLPCSRHVPPHGRRCHLSKRSWCGPDLGAAGADWVMQDVEVMPDDGGLGELERCLRLPPGAWLRSVNRRSRAQRPGSGSGTLSRPLQITARAFTRRRETAVGRAMGVRLTSVRCVCLLRHMTPASVHWERSRW